ncbi:4-hydroxythreonine-4-phosphate dehydrogenase [Pseudomonas sp. URIL14HWK12:I9]|nr:4-hydroxythreonine-4-phosphate dehydrogenase [Pseudomonas sp. URIL14HWK12:I12]PVZ26166.1 4-hydroxythreonine-4-phosphate dehydrogenase [Pseudomonas sp. URIL14HWK12:I10]PVZ36310.1 4-hydroxythreonine-4-phosphate dehydrogenase [Pseudomonas sp. URIL14HWK12:I11]SNZ18372.1 4-hydroxythreonine-4-phosphate dehydrogenase [Pseudomonas sp. URIL14HWK12:I9]
MKRLLILADDLTGAADCAVGFAGRARCAVALKAHEPLPAGADVVALDLDTRRMPPEAAALEHHRVLAVPGHDSYGLYKKIDSTLRGNYAAEIAALSERGLALIAPAYPALGRTTRQGVQWLDGAPVHQSETWRNEGLAGSADLVAALRAQGLRCAHLERSALAQASEHLRQALADGVQALICDASTDEDLAVIAAASAAHWQELFWVGSAGLAKALGPWLQANTRQAPHRAQGPVLSVVGSMASHSHGQAVHLAQASGALTTVLDPHALLSGTADHLGAITEALASGRDVVVTVSQRSRLGDQAAALSQALAASLQPALYLAGTLIATGGETARALLDVAGIGHLELYAEPAPGLVRGHAMHQGRPLTVITKAGAFGAPDALCAAWRQLDLCPANAGQEPPMLERPVIGITLGDATGVGPEIIVKALAHERVHAMCKPLVIGDAKRLESANRIVGGSMQVHAIQHPREALYEPGTIDCIDLGLIPEGLPYGKLSALAGDAAYQYIAHTVKLAEAGELQAICTAPLNKEALHAGGHLFPGHTELLAHLTGVEEVSMMLMTPTLRVIHVTTHIGIIDAIARIEPGLVRRTLERAHQTLVRAGIADPLIAVCGINPHAGENGLFGYGEEQTKIQPAIDELRARGWRVEGPLPADTLFFRAGRGDFDAVVAMYHDQGHGPVKVMGLEAGVNVTIGLPVIRTSVDHGTAFDIAGKGVADERSLIEALRQAVELAARPPA